MSGSYTAIHCHIVFSTKNHQPFLTPGHRPRLHEYLGGLLRKRGAVLLAAGGTADHMHLLVSLPKDKTIADLMRDLKSNSSFWLRRTFPELASFAWQEGYFAFAVGTKGISQVKAYIAKQEEHHRKQSFQEEYRFFLEQHGIVVDERYLWR